MDFEILANSTHTSQNTVEILTRMGVFSKSYLEAGLQTACRMLNTEILEIRLAGLSWIKECLMFQGHNYPKFSSLTELRSLIVNFHIPQSLFGPACHVELLSRSKDIIQWFAVFHGSEYLALMDILWTPVSTNQHRSIIKALIHVLIETQHFLNNHMTLDLLTKIRSLPASLVDFQILDLLDGITKRCQAFQQQSHSWPNVLDSIVPIFIDYFSTETAFEEGVKERSLNVFASVLEIMDVEARFQVFSDLVELVKCHSGSIYALKVLVHFIDCALTSPDEPIEYKQAIQTFIQTSNLAQVFLEDCQYYQAQARIAVSNLPLGTSLNVNDMILAGTYKHTLQMYWRLYVFRSLTAGAPGLSEDIAFLGSVYDVFVKDGITNSEGDMLFDSLKLVRL